MISSDPVVSSPDAGDSSSFLSSPGKTPLLAQEEPGLGEDEKEGDGSTGVSSPPAAAERRVVARSGSTGSSSRVEGVTGGGGEEGGDVEERQPQLQLPVPDLINKDPPPPCDVWQKASGPDVRLASTPRSGKTACRISLGEEALLGNGAPCGKGTAVSAEDAEPHPDLLSFEWRAQNLLLTQREFKQTGSTLTTARYTDPASLWETEHVLTGSREKGLMLLNFSAAFYTSRWVSKSWR